MKCGLLSIFTITFLTLALQAQIPNSGFENWTGTEPDGWVTNNAPGFAQPVKQSPTSHSGSSSVKVEIISPLPGLPYTGKLYSGFPVPQRFAELTGYYLFNQMGTDSLNIWVRMVKNNLSIGGGDFFTFGQASTWIPFHVFINYYSGETPDSANISISCGDGPTIGSYALVDDLAFMGISNIRKRDNVNLMQEFQVKQNYPNPFNPTTNIEFSIPQSADVELVIYNQLGQTIATLVNERLSAGSYSVDWNATDLPSGVYYYRMTAGDFSKTMKLMLMK